MSDDKQELAPFFPNRAAVSKWVDQVVAPAITPFLKDSAIDWTGWRVAVQAAFIESEVNYKAGKAKTHLFQVLAEHGEPAARTLQLGLIKCARLGLLPDPTYQHVAFIPYGAVIDCQLMYKAWLHLVQQHARPEAIKVDVIYKAEYKPPALGPNDEVLIQPDVIGRSAWKDDDIVASYCSILLPGRTRWITRILPRAELNKRRAKSRSSAWGDWFASMAKAKAIKALCSSGMLPISPQIVKEARDDDDELKPVEVRTVASAPLVAAPSEPPKPAQIAEDQKTGAQVMFDARDKEPLPSPEDHQRDLIMAIETESNVRSLSDKGLLAEAGKVVGKPVENWRTLSIDDLGKLLDALR